jgi:hypothetical protein
MHHHHFIITKFLLLIGVLVGVFYVFDYIKERYQAYQVKKSYYQKVDKGGKGLKGKTIESVGGGGSVNERKARLEKEGKIPKEKERANKVCSTYLEWEGCEQERAFEGLFERKT